MALTPNILFEDNHLLVVVKPPMLPTMGAIVGSESLVDQLKAYVRRKYQKPGNVYLGVVSRLDSWVSGVIVFARTSKAAERLNQQFRNRTCQKTYLALVPDHPNFMASGHLNDWLIKNEGKKKMSVVSKTGRRDDAQSASLTFKTLGQKEGERLLEIELETGRKHQIRVQLSAAGCPILGDKKYGSTARFPSGIALHSYRLRIDHPTQKHRLTFMANPPNYWRLNRFGFESESS